MAEISKIPMDSKGINVNTNRYYTIEEVMDLLQISRSTAYKLAHSRGVPVIKIGKILRFDKDLFDSWLKKQAVN